MPDFPSFEKAIGVHFKDQRLLTQAFIHRSYINENPNTGHFHNERFEFLGDAVLELSITKYLFDKYPNENEGELTSYRSALVNAVIIAEVASELGMNNFLLLSKGEQKDNGKARQYILANTYEALVGAIYLDQGYDIADDFIKRTLAGRIDNIVHKKLWRDAKSYIQELAQEHYSLTPVYKVMKETGPDHDKQFTVGIFFGSEHIASGKGKSKQEAETGAAENALEKKGWRE